LAGQQRTRLEQIAGLTADAAKAELIHGIENDARKDAANLVKRIEDESIERAKDKARRIISMAIQRIASEHVVETTVSVVDLPSDEMKGRIIGREGRNIRAFEQATGVDLIVDDTPGAVILSCFEPVRREIARLALLNLIQDGRIHPGRIEELAAKVQLEMEEKLLRDGEAAALEVGIPDLNPELQRLLGRLRFIFYSPCSSTRSNWRGLRAHGRGARCERGGCQARRPPARHRQGGGSRMEAPTSARPRAAAQLGRLGHHPCHECRHGDRPDR
jgi:ribonuclease Y